MVEALRPVFLKSGFSHFVRALVWKIAETFIETKTEKYNYFLHLTEEMGVDSLVAWSISPSTSQPDMVVKGNILFVPL